MVFADPSSLPLLNQNEVDIPLVGIIYPTPSNTTIKSILDGAFGEVISNGVNTYQLSMTWTQLEDGLGNVSTTYFNTLMNIISATNLVPLLTLQTIDTNQLQLPSDLEDSSNGNELAPSITWNSETLLNRWFAIIDAIIPTYVQKKGFYISIANEADVWLSSHLSQTDDFKAFFDKTKSRIQNISSDLAVGITFTHSGIAASHEPYLDYLLERVDVGCFTYYPLYANFSMKDPSVVSSDLEEVRLAVEVPYVILQEVGYSSGNEPIPTNLASYEKQKQFVKNVFDYVAQHSNIITFSYLALVDFDEQQCDFYEMAYTGGPNPPFREYICNLGIRKVTDGSPKPAYQQFLDSLQSLRTPQTTTGTTTGDSGSTTQSEPVSIASQNFHLNFVMMCALFVFLKLM